MGRNKLPTFKKILKLYFLVDNNQIGLENTWRMRIGIFLNRYQRGNGDINTFKDVIIILGIGGVAIWGSDKLALLLFCYSGSFVGNWVLFYRILE